MASPYSGGKMLQAIRGRTSCEIHTFDKPEAESEAIPGEQHKEQHGDVHQVQNILIN